MEKLKKNSQVKMTSAIEDSVIFNDQDTIVTDVPMINVALSGDLNGGMHSGLTVLAGPSKHFKSSFALLIAAAYQRKHPDGVILFYDSEFGTPLQYFKTFGVDTSRVVHTPIMDIEELKFDIISQLEELQRNDKVLILIDSIGNLASKKEVEDAKEKKSVADMSRAKSLKSLFRMVTPYLKTKNLSMIAINHTYKTMEMFSKDVVSGGCLVAGTKIKMADGSSKAIESVVPGDLVLTMEGEKVVTHSWNPDTLEEGTPECLKVTFSDGTSVVCSETHPFLSSHQWKPANELVVGDAVKQI